MVPPASHSAAPPLNRAPVPPAAFARACEDFFEETVRLFGLPPSVGQIYGLLYGTPAPLSFTDIVERLGISNGSASQGLQFLRSLGAVRAVGPEGNGAGGSSVWPGPGGANAGAMLAASSRREYFEPELGLRLLVSGVLRERVAPLAGIGGDRIAQLRALAEDVEGDLPPETRGSASRAGRRRAVFRRQKDFCLERVEQLETWRRRIRLVLPALTVLLGPKKKKPAGA